MSMVSIIIPIFNSEKTLYRCLKSVRSQAYWDIEVILVDDGSVDKSAEICFSFVSCDSRFKYYYKKNGGLSSSRNFGLMKSRGKILCFLDSDDYYSQNFIQELIIRIIEDDVDVAVSSVVSVSLDKLYEHEGPTESKIITVENFIRACFSLESGTDYCAQGGFVCNKMFKRDVIGENFFPNHKGAEDELFLSKLFSHIKKVAYVPSAKYFYVYAPSSLSNRKDFFIEFLNSRRSLIEDCQNEMFREYYLAAFYQALVEQTCLAIRRNNELILKPSVIEFIQLGFRFLSRRRLHYHLVRKEIRKFEYVRLLFLLPCAISVGIIYFLMSICRFFKFFLKKRKSSEE